MYIISIIRSNILEVLGHNVGGNHCLFVLGKIVGQKEIITTIAIVKEETITLKT